jgi:small subunit ribosomal protein S6
MSKKKLSQTPHYELLYIVSNKFSENEIPEIKEKIEKIITDNEGQITYKEDWGKKRLAYAIESFKNGYYYLVEFDLPGEKLSKINNYLRLSRDILRHMIVKKDKKTEEEKNIERKQREKIREQEELEKKEQESKKNPVKIKRIEKTERIEEVENTTEETEKEKKEEKKAKKEADSVDIKDLDERLDKILDTSSLI